MEKHFLKEFFAVTQTSVYLVSSEKDEKGVPIVEKIALRGPSAVAKGGRLHNGQFVGIMKDQINLYFAEYRNGRPERPEYVSTSHWGGHTSPVSALFLDRQAALRCFRFKRQDCDLRWRKETEEVLAAIGDDHPVFIVSKHASTALAYPD